MKNNFKPETVLDYTSYWLAADAGIASPDTPTSPGSQFLLGIQSDILERAEEIIEDGSDSDALHEIADSAVPVYTHPMWQTFVDLCAYNEDLDDLGGSTGDMTKDAMSSLYMIASRLANHLAETLIAAHEEHEETTEAEVDVEIGA